MKSTMVFCLLCLALAAGCSDDAPTITDPDPSPDPTPASPLPSLAGTWDISGPDGPEGVIEVADNRFVVSIGGWGVAYERDESGTLVTTEIPKNAGAGGAAQVHDVTTTHTEHAVDYGAIPLLMGGDWTFATMGGRCEASIRADEFDAGCENVQGRLPDGIPDLNATATGERTSVAESIFGELGGTWRITSSDTQEVCDVSFAGSTFTANCTYPIQGDGVEISFAGDTASGETDQGYEFTALRRP